mmetsp:Transcript_13192/g.27922  ORF Transcript_13192/g.27922 Transcript_13192/m.27922 type:complete len:244 (-) Transcript_13192:1407-2138(-)
MLRSSARRTASCQRFRNSVTSCLKASSRAFASRSLVRNLFSKSLNISSLSFLSLLDSLSDSSAAPALASSTSFLRDLFSSLSSFNCCSKTRFVARCFSDSSFAVTNSASSFFDRLSPLRAADNSSLKDLTSFSKPSIFFNAASFVSFSISKSSFNSLASPLAFLTACSICDCFLANPSPSSRNALMICSCSRLSPPADSALFKASVSLVCMSSTRSLARRMRFLASSLVSVMICRSWVDSDSC